MFGLRNFWISLWIAVGAFGANAQDLFIDPQFSVVRTNGIVYGSAGVMSPSPGNFTLLLDLYEPGGVDAPPLRPGYVLIHGGGFTGGNRNGMSTEANALASRGYVCISISYRLDGQQPVIGAEFQPFFQDLGSNPLVDAIAAAVEDAVTAYRWFVANAEDLQLDVTRIGIGGSSAGAITSLFAAYSIDDHEVTNLPSFGVVMDLWGALYGLVGDLESHEPPLIAIHGENDTVVPFSFAEDLAAEANAEMISFEYYPMPGFGHGVPIFTTEISPGVTLFDRVVLFSYEHLGLASIGQALGTKTWRSYR